MNFKQISDMANVLPKDTGLHHKVWISSSYPVHVPRIKVFTGNGSETISVSIEDNPKQVAGRKDLISNKDLNLVYEWVKLNKDVLLQYWNDEESDTVELIRNLKKL